jgi:lipid II:glycine glycyltransferase (peptidoglycan interpeptide bridge formation enzyme)
VGLAEPWGSATFVARDGDKLLAAVLVGWAAGRAYYIAGGSTTEGYRRSASVWLQWRVMAECAGRGRLTYNLGGVPAGAAESGHAQHGLHRFKAGFGAAVTPARGAHWRLKPAHLKLHAVMSRLAARFRG